MNNEDRELEAKFALTSLEKLTRKLVALGARVVQPRVLETNLRFDTPQRKLLADHRVLRLRKDERVRLTYKGPAQAGQEVGVRQEIEFEVDDFEAARRFFEALGYDVVMVYEKYRTTYALGEVEVMLDEMPYGLFAEIEGATADQIHRAALQLGLNWDARAAVSYQELFFRLRDAFNLPVKYLTFDEFQPYTFTPADFGLKPAD